MNEKVTGSIMVSMNQRPNQRQLRSKSFFRAGNYYKVFDNGKCLTITSIGIDYNGKSYKAYLYRGWLEINILSGMPCGKYSFDEEESTFDEVRIYYNEV